MRETGNRTCKNTPEGEVNQSERSEKAGIEETGRGKIKEKEDISNVFLCLGGKEGKTGNDRKRK